MAREDEDFELLIDDPADVQVEPVKAGEPAPKPKAPDVSDGISALKQQLSQERHRAEQNERRAVEAERTAEQAVNYAGSTQQQAIISALGAKTERLTALKEELKNASAIGDAERVADLTDAMTDVKYDIRELENGKRVIEARLQQPRQPQPEQRRTQVEGEENLSSPTKEWLDNHRDAVTDEKKYMKMQAAHLDAVADGIQVDTPEYFAHIEARVYGSTKPARVETRDEPAQRREVRPSAPVERDADTGRRQVKLQITPEMREAAEISGMTIKEYAEQYVREHGIGR